MGQGVDNLDATRQLEPGQRRRRLGKHRVRIQLGAGHGHDVREHRLAGFVVIHTEHGYFRDAGLCPQHGLDLGRIDVEPVDDHKFSGATDEE